MKTKNIFLSMLLISIIALISCEKEDITDGYPSASILDAQRNNNNVPDTISCANEVREFISLFQVLREKRNNPPVFYDRRLIDLLSGEIDASACNKVDAAYYVTLGGKKKCGKFVTSYWQRTIESPESFFKVIDRDLESYEEFTGNVLGRFFSEYDVFGVDLHKYTTGCLAGKYKMTFIIWIATDPH